MFDSMSNYVNTLTFTTDLPSFHIPGHCSQYDVQLIDVSYTEVVIRCLLSYIRVLQLLIETHLLASSIVVVN